LAIVVPIGTVILVNGTSEINSFNNELSNSLTYKNQGVREDLVFEHIRFDPASKDVMIAIRNTGSIESAIERIILINTTSQDVIYHNENLASFMFIKDAGRINFAVSDITGTWSNNANHDIKISITTSKGNFFDTIARPFNT
jgi:hypothetical protein